jgi:hypothetical protein
MTPDEARQMYRDQMDLHGETISIRRYTGTGLSRTHVDRPCRARVTGYAAEELIGSITQGDRKIIVLAEDLEGESPNFVIAKADKVYDAVRFPNELSIQSVDDSTARIGATLIAYILQARG